MTLFNSKLPLGLPVKPNIPFEDMEIGLLHLIKSCAELGWPAGAIQIPNL
jgi:hypothetical protein